MLLSLLISQLDKSTAMWERKGCNGGVDRKGFFENYNKVNRTLTAISIAKAKLTASRLALEKSSCTDFRPGLELDRKSSTLNSTARW